MRRRHKLPGGASKAMFSRHADRTHKRNYSAGPRAMPMRGGIRL